MSLVQLILREDVPSLGDAGDVVQVKVGFARNFLLPQGKAVLATESRIAEIAHHRRVVAEKLAKELKDLHAVRDRLQALRLEISVKAGDEGKLFGSVTAANIAELFKEKGFDIDRRKIQLAEPIKAIGDHLVPVRLRNQLIAQVPLKVSVEA